MASEDERRKPPVDLVSCDPVQPHKYRTFNGFICEILKHWGLSIDLGHFIKYPTVK